MSKTADKIKNFFAKKKQEAKFKLSGPGRKLNSDTPAPSKSSSKKDVYIPPKRTELSQESVNALNAAMARITPRDTRDFNSSLATIKAQVRRELEEEQKSKQQTASQSEKADPKTSFEQNLKKYAVQGVYFRCAFVSEEILPKKEWKDKIKAFLYGQLDTSITQFSEENGLTACLIIHNCNVKERAVQCIEILIKYLNNIIQHPTEEKYKKIRMSNKVFCERVKDVEGAMEFLTAAGFSQISLDNEDFLIWSDDNVDSVQQLSMFVEALENSEPFQLELDRNIQVLLPSQIRHMELPPDFYKMSPEELKREQQARTEALEKAQMLMTKAMREKEELRTVNKYRYALIRVRFPNGIYLQVSHIIFALVISKFY
jgi:UBX domain-containing protein 6